MVEGRVRVEEVAVAEGVIGQVGESEFDREVLAADGPVLVEFFATWCGNCRRLAPVLDRLAGELADQLRFVKVDAEANPKLTARYGVSSTPTLIVFNGGQPVVRAVGAQPEAAVRELIAAGSAGRTEALPAGPASWVPGDACTLPSADRPLRMAEFDDLFATAVRAVDRIDPTRLRLRLDPRPEVAARTADLAVRETDCCGFFTFTLTATDEQLALEVTVPNDRSAVLDGLVARATAGEARA
jgi:thioredoxin